MLGCDREVAADLQAALHPLATLAEQTGNLTDAQMIVVDERADYPGLIDGGDGAWRCIGDEQQALVLVGRCGCFEHHGKFLRVGSFLLCRQALEAIDDLEAAIVGGHYAQGQRYRITWGVLLCGAWTQAGVGGAQPIDGYHAKRACGAVRGHGLEGRATEPAVAHDFKAQFTVIGFVIEGDLDLSVEEIGRIDLVARCDFNAAGPVEAQQTAPGSGQTSGTDPFQGEVVSDMLVRWADTVEGMHDDQHAVAAAA